MTNRAGDLRSLHPNVESKLNVFTPGNPISRASLRRKITESRSRASRGRSFGRLFGHCGYENIISIRLCEMLLAYCIMHHSRYAIRKRMHRQAHRAGWRDQTRRAAKCSFTENLIFIRTSQHTQR